MFISAIFLSGMLALNAPNPDDMVPALKPQSFEIAYEMTRLKKGDRLAMKFYDLKTSISLFGSRPPEYPVDSGHGILTKCDFGADFCAYDDDMSEFPLIITSNIERTDVLLGINGIKLTINPHFSSRCLIYELRNLTTITHTGKYLIYTVCDNYGITHIESGIIGGREANDEYDLRSFHGLGFEATRSALHPFNH